MKNKLHYSPAAQRDLDDIWDYISADLANPIAAAHTVNEIIDTIEQLSDFAEVGAPLNSIIDVQSDYRFLVCGSYLAFYRVIGHDVYIDHVLYGRRDFMRILFGDALPAPWMM